jgi:hypothetical protein
VKRLFEKLHSAVMSLSESTGEDVPELVVSFYLGIHIFEPHGAHAGRKRGGGRF